MANKDKDAPKRGYFITLEGGEGAGKTTQIKLIAKQLQQQGFDVLLTREPGGNAGAEQIRELLLTGEIDRWTPMTEALLMAASRAEHVSRTIIPALSQGKWVLCDRFADSSVAYQGVARGLGFKKIRKLQQIVLGDFGPDLTFIFDLPPRQGLARAFERFENVAQGTAEDRFERMDMQFHEDLRAGYRKIAEREPERCRMIDASKSIEDIQSEIWAKLSAYCDI